MPHPLETKMFYWEDGVAFYGKGFDSKKMTKRIMVPIKGEKLYICGENYSKYQAWCEGALMTCEQVLEKIDCKMKLIEVLVPIETKKVFLTLSTPVIFPKHLMI